jgi:hypothetical protein
MKKKSTGPVVKEPPSVYCVKCRLWVNTFEKDPSLIHSDSPPGYKRRPWVCPSCRGDNGSPGLTDLPEPGTLPNPYTKADARSAAMRDLGRPRAARTTAAPQAGPAGPRPRVGTLARYIGGSRCAWLPIGTVGTVTAWYSKVAKTDDPALVQTIAVRFPMKATILGVAYLEEA